MTATGEGYHYPACNRCMGVDALIHSIQSYLHIPDLFQCKLVSSTWQLLAVRCLQDLAKHPDYCCFTYLLNDNLDSSNDVLRSSRSARIQRQLAKIHNRQQQQRGGLLLFGGAFGAPYSKHAYIHDYRISLYGGRCKHIVDFFPGDKQGAVASYYDPNEGEIVVLGGWDESRDKSLNRVMKLSVTNFQPVTPTQANELVLESSESGESDEDFDEDVSQYDEEAIETAHGLPSSTSSTTNNTSSSSSSSKWRHHSNLPERVCYGAATMTLTGDIMHMGGGNTPFRGARVFDHSYLYSQSRKQWQSGVIGKMNEVRCGHSALTMLDGKVMAIGGYGGEMLYYDSVEWYDFDKQKWYQLPPMKYKRSGMVAVLGPGGSVYVTGGSENGELGQRALERFDAREGKWVSLAPMQRPRGYLTGALTASLNLYVNGGLHNYRFQGGMERYDIRQNVWETLIGSSHCVLEDPTLLNLADFPIENIPASGILPNHGFPDDELIRAGHQLHYIF